MTDSTTLIVTANDDTTADLVADALASRDSKAVLIRVGISRSIWRSPASLAMTASGVMRSLPLSRVSSRSR
jgi:hypothetical protein